MRNEISPASQNMMQGAAMGPGLNAVSPYMPNLVSNVTPNIVPNEMPNLMPNTVPNVMPNSIPNAVPNVMPNSSLTRRIRCPKLITSCWRSFKPSILCWSS